MAEIYINDNDEVHNDNGPAIAFRNLRGDVFKTWYKNGKIHKTDRPAEINNWIYEDYRVQNGVYRYILFNCELSKEEFNSWIDRVKLLAIAHFKINLFNERKLKIFTLNGNIHKEGGPAIKFPNGKALWLKHDELHKTDGSVWPYDPKYENFHLNGRWFSEKEFNSWIKRIQYGFQYMDEV